MKQDAAMFTESLFPRVLAVSIHALPPAVVDPQLTISA
jgi:hypothetical protein